MEIIELLKIFVPTKSMIPFLIDLIIYPVFIIQGIANLIKMRIEKPIGKISKNHRNIPVCNFNCSTLISKVTFGCWENGHVLANWSWILLQERAEIIGDVFLKWEKFDDTEERFWSCLIGFNFHVIVWWLLLENKS